MLWFESARCWELAKGRSATPEKRHHIIGRGHPRFNQHRLQQLGPLPLEALLNTFMHISFQFGRSPRPVFQLLPPELADLTRPPRKDIEHGGEDPVRQQLLLREGVLCLFACSKKSSCDHGTPTCTRHLCQNPLQSSRPTLHSLESCLRIREELQTKLVHAREEEDFRAVGTMAKQESGTVDSWQTPKQITNQSCNAPRCSKLACTWYKHLATANKKSTACPRTRAPIGATWLTKQKRNYTRNTHERFTQITSTSSQVHSTLTT